MNSVAVQWPSRNNQITKLRDYHTKKASPVGIEPTTQLDWNQSATPLAGEAY